MYALPNAEYLLNKTCFILETYNDGACPELSSAVYEACDEQNWLDNADNNVCFPDTTISLIIQMGMMHGVELSHVIPVGSVEFVNRWAEMMKLAPIHALNIPPELNDDAFLSRKVFHVQKLSDLDGIAKRYGTLLVKPGRNPKRFEAFPYTPGEGNISGEIPDDEPLFVSQMLNTAIVSEWRVFCRRGRVVDIRPYIFDEWVCPSRQKVEAMADRLKGYPAVTLDVAVLSNGDTVALEVHNFISCGLYGFGGPKMLQMTKAAWKYEIELQRKGT